MKKDQVSKEIRYKIMSGEYKLHEAIPPERDLCAVFDVSRVTIRTAISQLIDEGVLERKGRVGTFVRMVPPPEKRKKTDRKKHIVYIYFSSIQNDHNEENPQKSVIYRGIENYANRADLTLMVQSAENYLRNGVPGWADGVIMGGTDLRRHLPEVRSQGIPVVSLFFTPETDIDVDVVCWDGFGAGMSAALRAVELGHKKIMLTALHYRNEKFLQPSFRRRIAGFMDMVQELDLEVTQQVIHEEKLSDVKALKQELACLREKHGTTLTVDCSGIDPNIFGGTPAISIGAWEVKDHPTTDFLYCDNERVGFLAAARLAVIMKDATIERLRLLVPISKKFVLKKLSNS